MNETNLNGKPTLMYVCPKIVSVSSSLVRQWHTYIENPGLSNPTSNRWASKNFSGAFCASVNLSNPVLISWRNWTAESWKATTFSWRIFRTCSCHWALHCGSTPLCCISFKKSFVLWILAVPGYRHNCNSQRQFWKNSVSSSQRIVSGLRPRIPTVMAICRKRDEMSSLPIRSSGSTLFGSWGRQRAGTEDEAGIDGETARDL